MHSVKHGSNGNQRSRTSLPSHEGSSPAKQTGEKKTHSLNTKLDANKPFVTEVKEVKAKRGKEQVITMAGIRGIRRSTRGQQHATKGEQFDLCDLCCCLSFEHRHPFL